MVNHGSTFTLYLPAEHAARRKPAAVVAAVGQGQQDRELGREVEPGAPDASILLPEADDRASIAKGDRVLLVVENDLAFGQFLLDTAHDHGFKGVVTAFGASALAHATEYRVDAITLDLRLPDVDGRRVLGLLKSGLATRHIPVYVISTEEERARCLELGAADVLAKPIQEKELLERLFADIRADLERPDKQVLVVAPDRTAGEEVARWLSDDEVAVRIAGCWDEALVAIEAAPRTHCLVVAAEARPIPAPRLLAALGALGNVPVVLWWPGAGPAARDEGLHRLAGRHAVKIVQSPERLVDEVTARLHLRLDRLGEEKQRVVKSLHETDEVLAGKKALIVDDDVRNIFAMTSVLEQHRMTVVSAENGRDAIDLLRSTPGIDIVLMDIMMPEMDGYDTIRAIRRIPSFGRLPILAVTAKAMKGDREKCIEAGAWDYLPKPIDSMQMLSMCRSWLRR
jgi:CheY-like chemotaxis protein